MALATAEPSLDLGAPFAVVVLFSRAGVFWALMARVACSFLALRLRTQSEFGARSASLARPFIPEAGFQASSLHQPATSVSLTSLCARSPSLTVVARRRHLGRPRMWFR